MVLKSRSKIQVLNSPKVVVFYIKKRGWDITQKVMSRPLPSTLFATKYPIIIVKKINFHKNAIPFSIEYYSIIKSDLIASRLSIAAYAA